ncbi:MAG: hypothetical protein LZF85_08935, partial [Nitrosomonas sp.]|uniref:hypothetical protein n=1 Tax=Nitrosomonas sp. TaxID=42353 RepID=UPI0025E674FB
MDFALVRGAHVRPAGAEVIVMRADYQALPGELRIGAGQNADDVTQYDVAFRQTDILLPGLEKAVVVTAGQQANVLKLLGDIRCRFIQFRRAQFASFERMVRQVG